MVFQPFFFYSYDACQCHLCSRLLNIAKCQTLTEQPRARSGVLRLLLFYIFFSFIYFFAMAVCFAHHSVEFSDLCGVAQCSIRVKR